MKTKVKIFINPLANCNKFPVNIVDLTDVIDFLSSKYFIDTIDIQLNENKRPSEIYFELLLGLCKSVCSKVQVDNYIGNKKPNVYRMDSFSCVDIIIDNDNYTTIFNNAKSVFQSKQDFCDSFININ